MTVGDVVYRAAPGGSSKFFLASVDDRVIGQSTTLAGAQTLCEREAAQQGSDE